MSYCHFWRRFGQHYIPSDKAVNQRFAMGLPWKRWKSVKKLLVIFAFVAGALLVFVGVQKDSFIDLLVGGMLLVLTVWELSQKKRGA